MDKLYYIETSNRRVYFGSSNLNEMMLKKSYQGDPITCRNIEMSSNLTDVIDLKYTWDFIMVDSTPNGFFMKIHLADPHYGSPEYKIYRA